MCGVPSNACNGAKLGLYLGLHSARRPIDIHFILTPNKTVSLEAISNSTFLMRPFLAGYNACNESFQYDQLALSANCTCKVTNDFFILILMTSVLKNYLFKVLSEIM